MANETTEIVVTVETPTPAENNPPSTSSHGETTPAAAAAVDLALTVGSLVERVSQLETSQTETEATAEAAAEAAQAAVSIALTTPAAEPMPEPEPEAEAVTLVEIPSSAAEDAPAKTPAQARSFLSRLLLG